MPLRRRSFGLFMASRVGANRIAGLNPRGALATVHITFRVPRSVLTWALLGTLIRAVSVYVMVGVWRAVAAAGTIDMGTYNYLASYTLIAAAVGGLMSPRTSMSEHIASGSLAVRMMWPIRPTVLFSMEWIGPVIWRVFMNVVAMLIVGSTLSVSFPPIIRLPLFAASLGLAAAVGLYIDFAFALLTMNLNNGVWFVESIRSAVTALVSGAVIPLHFIPWGLGDAFKWLPFAATAAAPLEVYLGGRAPLQLILFQTAWAVVGTISLTAAWRFTSTRLMAAGG